MYTLVGVFKLGWVTNFISHSVIAGFMSGASVIIGLSQVLHDHQCAQVQSVLSPIEQLFKSDNALGASLDDTQNCTLHLGID